MTTEGYNEPPPKIDKTKPIEEQKEVIDWITNMLVGKEIIKKDKKGKK